MAMTSSVWVASAALCWGLAGGVAGVLVADGWNPFLIAFYRGAIGLLFVVAWLVLRPHAKGLTNPRLWLWSAVAGLGVAGNFAFYFMSIAQGSVAVAATLMYSAPIFVYLVSFAFKLEQPSPIKWAAIVIVFIGIALLTQIYRADAAGITMMGVATGLLAGIAYSVFIFGFKFASAYGRPQTILVIAFTVLVATLAGPSAAHLGNAALLAQAWPLLVTLGVLGAGIPFVLYIIGLSRTAPAVASITAMVEPVTASLFGVVVLHESLAGLQVFGMGLILVAVTALSFYSAGRGES